MHLRGTAGLALAALVLAGVGGSCPEAAATRMIPLTIEQLAGKAGLVVRGQVDAVEVARDSGGRIYTRVGLAILEVWKGRMEGVQGRCELVVGGGLLGDRALRVSGQAEYGVGDEVVAFLARNEAGEWVTLGLSQGRFRVHRDTSTGRRVASNPFWGEESAAGEPRVTGYREPMKRPLDLDELKRRTMEAGR